MRIPSTFKVVTLTTIAILSLIVFSYVFDLSRASTLPPMSDSLVQVERNSSSHPIQTVVEGFLRANASSQVCFVTRTYQKQYAYLLTHLLSISHNPVAKPRVLIVITEENSKPEPVVESILTANSLTGYDMAHLLPITPQLAQNISADYKTDYGYSYTDAAIEYLLQHSKEYPCDYLIFTNGDNLYYAGYIDDYLLPDISEGIQAIGTNFISRYAYTWLAGDNGENVMDDRSRQMRNAEMKSGSIDLGAFVIDLRVMAADPEMRFIKQNLLNPMNIKGGVECADGKLIEYVASKGLKTRIHRQTFLIHQR